jgi:glycosyltransferase involved in cell wall biosynthesis
MRICHVITRLILGGAQENTILSCRGLHQRGHDVTLVTGPAVGPEGELLSAAKADGYRVTVLDTMRREIHPFHDWRAYRELVRLLRDLRPDVMHSHSSKAGILARAAASHVGGMKIVHTIHGLPFHPYQGAVAHRLYVELERHAARKTDAIISVADAMTRQALSAGVGEARQYTTIYSGMEVEPYLARPSAADEFRRGLNLPDGAVLVTQVSRLAELKGHEFILQAARLLRSSNVYICFVGDGRLRPAIERQIAEMGLPDRFRLTGLLPPAMIPAVMHATDILVHCSLREGLARALPQAMLAGKPVVSYDVDGAAEVVSADTGVLLPPREVTGLAAAIDQLAGAAAQRERLGRAGREMAKARFDWRVMVDQIEALYKRL